MTKSQFTAALDIAKSERDLSHVDDSVLYGCALPHFVPVAVTLDVAAKFIRWHCLCLNGQVDSEALNEMHSIARKRWNILCN